MRARFEPERRCAYNDESTQSGIGMAGKRVFCPSCGVETEGYVTVQQGSEMVHCSICGLVMADDSRPQAVELLKCVAFAEDSDTLRTMLEKMLVQQQLAREVVSARNGTEFVALVSRRLKENQPISLAILDVEMPNMTGIQAAATLRKLEDSLGRQRRIPLLFFTSKPCDERFKGILKQLEPSSYVNKGQSPDPLELVKRIQKVLFILFKGASQAA